MILYIDYIIDGVSKQSPERQLAFLEAMNDLLDPARARHIVSFDGKQDEEQHELSVAGGRAARALQTLLNIDIPIVNTSSTDDTLQDARASVTDRIDRMRETIIETNQDRKSISDSETYARKYKDALESTEGAAPVIRDIISEWGLIGRSVEELLATLDLEDASVSLLNITVPYKLTNGASDYYLIPLGGGLVHQDLLLRSSSGVIQSFRIITY